MKSELLTPSCWSDYELIDSGAGEKLERFGRYVLSRPEPQALWQKSLPQSEWDKRSDATFKRDGHSEDRGEWKKKAGMPEKWHVEYRYKGMHLKMRLGLTSFKHVGIFAEQAANWEFIYDRVKEQKSKGVDSKVLNLFAYTGGATLAARSAGAAVTHVDSVKQVVSWTRENMELSGLDNIRWIVEDVRKFVNKEIKRGNTYTGLILDPPAYGLGAEAERWILDKDLYELLKNCGKILAPGGFVILNLYSMGLSALIAKGLIEQVFGINDIEFGELYFKDCSSKCLPFGVFARG